MTFNLSEVTIYLIIVVVLLAIQIWQNIKIGILEKRIQVLANQLMFLFLSLKPREDAKEETKEEA